MKPMIEIVQYSEIFKVFLKSQMSKTSNHLD